MKIKLKNGRIMNATKKEADHLKEVRIEFEVIKTKKNEQNSNKKRN